MTDLKEAEKSVQEIIISLHNLKKEIGKVIVGQEEIIDQMLITFLAGGHALLEGVPGLAKTLMIRTLSEAINLKFRRIQFTPDLMPSDIIGTEILEEDHTTGKRIFKFNHGPIFANILLADEINDTHALIYRMDSAACVCCNSSRMETLWLAPILSAPARNMASTVVRFLIPPADFTFSLPR